MAKKKMVDLSKMTELEKTHYALRELKNQILKVPTFKQLIQYANLVLYLWQYDTPIVSYEYGKYPKSWFMWFCRNSKDMDEVQSCHEMYYTLLLAEAPHYLDSYMLYLEKDRPPKERFYLPRRKQLLKQGLTQALQDIEEDKYDFLTISMPPGSG